MKASCSNTWIFSSPSPSLKAEVLTDPSMVLDTQNEFLLERGLLERNPLQSKDLDGEKEWGSEVFFKFLRLRQFDP